MTAQAFLIGSGSATSLGPSHLLHTNATLAGINRLADHPYLQDEYGEPVIVARARYLAEHLHGEERLCALAAPALKECLALLASLDRGKLPVPCFFGLPSVRPGLEKEAISAVAQALHNMLPGYAVLKGVAYGPTAVASGLAGIRSCFQEGTADFAILGGVDSLCDSTTLRHMEKTETLFCRKNPWGRIPGEAASFHLLARQSKSADLRLRAEQLACAKADEPPGASLGGLFEQLGSQLPDSLKFTEIACNLMGDRDLQEEFGQASLKAAHHIDPNCALVAPMDLWGDVGAAWIPLLLGLLAHQARAGHSGNNCLIWSAAEDGARAALWAEV